jgi:hypothetical protein
MINKEPDTGGDLNSGEILPDEKTAKKIHQHLSDKSDQISEEDIKNVTTGIPEESTLSLGQNASPERSGEDKNDMGDDKDPEKLKDTKDDRSIITPWNILGS